MPELSDRLKSLDITLTSAAGRYVEHEWPHFAYEVTLHFAGKTLTTDYKAGLGHGTVTADEYGRQVPVSSRMVDVVSTPRGNMSLKQAAAAGYLKPGKPALADVLSCLLSDANGADQTFEDWASDLGYDADSRKALETYLLCQKIRNQLIGILGGGLFAELSGLEH